MTTTNHQRVTEGLQALTGVLAPCVARELRAKRVDEAGRRASRSP